MVESHIVVNMLLAWDEAVKAHVWRVDGTVAREQQQVVQEATECAAKEWGYHWDLQMLLAGAYLMLG